MISCIFDAKEYKKFNMNTKKLRLSMYFVAFFVYFLYKSLDHPSLFRLQPLFLFTNLHDYLASAF